MSSFFGNKKSDSTTATSQQQQQQQVPPSATGEFTQKLENPQTEFESDTAVTDFERRSNESIEHMHQQEIDDAKAAAADADVVVDAEGNVKKTTTAGNKAAGENVATGTKAKIGAAMKKAAGLVPGSGGASQEDEEEEEAAKLGKGNAAWETK